MSSCDISDSNENLGPSELTKLCWHDKNLGPMELTKLDKKRQCVY